MEPRAPVLTLLLRACAVIVVAAVSGYLAIVLHEAARPLDAGATIGACGPADPCTVREVRLAARGGNPHDALAPGDVVLDVDGAPAWLEAEEDATAFFSSREGRAQVLRTRRGDDERRVTVVPVRTVGEASLPELVVTWLTRFLSVAVGAMLLWSRPRSAVAWLAALVIVCAALGSDYPIHKEGAGGTASAIHPIAGPAVVLVASIVHAAGGLLFPVLWLVFPAYPVFLPRRWWVPLLVMAPWLPFALNEVQLTLALLAGREPLVTLPFASVMPAATLVTIVGATLLVLNLGTNPDRLVRRRLRGVLAAVVAVAVLWVLAALAPLSGSEGLAVLADLSLRLSASLLPVALGLAILRHRAFGLRVYVRDAARRALARQTLALLVVTPMLVLAYHAGRDGWRDAIGHTGLLSAIAAAALLAALRRPLLRWVDARLAGPSVGAQALLLDLGMALRNARTAREVEAAVTRAVQRAFRPGVLVVRAFENEGAEDLGVAEIAAISAEARDAFLERRTDPGWREAVQVGGHRARPFAEADLWIVPISDVRGARGFVLAGERPSGEPYEGEDRQLLAAIAHAAATHLEALELADTVLAERAARDRMTAAFAEERERLSRELHDGLGSTLSRISVLADAGASGDGAVGTLARDGISELRQMLWATDTSAESWPDTIAHLRRHALETCEAAGLDCDFAVLGTPPDAPLRPAQRLALVRSVQQALANAAAHAAARRVTLTLVPGPYLVSLTIEDDGRGFDPGSAPGRREGHYGLESLAARAREIGGAFVVDSAPGRGTTLTLSFPVGRPS